MEKQADSSPLESCPFCGSGDIRIISVMAEEGKRHYLLCAECGARGPRVEASPVCPEGGE